MHDPQPRFAATPRSPSPRTRHELANLVNGIWLQVQLLNRRLAREGASLASRDAAASIEAESRRLVDFLESTESEG